MTLPLTNHRKEQIPMEKMHLFSILHTHVFQILHSQSWNAYKSFVKQHFPYIDFSIINTLFSHLFIAPQNIYDIFCLEIFCNYSFWIVVKEVKPNCLVVLDFVLEFFPQRDFRLKMGYNGDDFARFMAEIGPLVLRAPEFR